MNTRRLGRWTAVVFLAAALSAPHAQSAPEAASASLRSWAPSGAVGRALQRDLRGDASPIAAFYEARAFHPLWVKTRSVRPEAFRLLAVLRAAGEEGLDPARYHPARLEGLVRTAADSRAPGDLARAEAALSAALAAYVRDLRTSPPAGQMIFTDPALQPAATDATAVLQPAAADLAGYLAGVRRMNPVYQQFRRALAEHRARAGGADMEALLLANLARARQIPPDPGRRFILVDAAGAQLWLFEDGRVVDAMPVVVGKPSQPTPALAGVIRYAVYNPFWNIPVDLVRDDIAPRVLREGTGALQAERLEVLSDWSAQARPLDPAQVDWTEAAQGRRMLRVRQRPGADNMMGKVKLMLPNELGIYLHDTPHRWAFASDRRTFSSGCVRLERALPLAERLLGQAAPAALPAEAEHRIDLPEPVPVFITYFTVWPGPQGLERRADVYRRDAELIAQLGLDPVPRALASL